MEELTFKECLEGLDDLVRDIDREASANRRRWAMVQRLKEILEKASQAETFLMQAESARATALQEVADAKAEAKRLKETITADEAKAEEVKRG
jgi:hypothetical protein